MSCPYGIRVNCPECDRPYADRKGLKRHLMGGHQLKYSFRSEATQVVTGAELQAELQKLNIQ